MATVLHVASPFLLPCPTKQQPTKIITQKTRSFSRFCPNLSSQTAQESLLLSRRLNLVASCFTFPSTSESRPVDPTNLYVSGLSFRTTEESLRNAFQKYGELVKVNLVMDRIANRPRGFAFLQYSTEEESMKAIEGMHGKFLEGRVIFVEISKQKPKTRQRANRRPSQY